MAYLFNTIYILVYVTLSVLHVANLLLWRYILSLLRTVLYMYIPSTAATLNISLQIRVTYRWLHAQASKLQGFLFVYV